MLTALDDEAHQIRAYKAGADDYMVKPCNFRLLLARMVQLIKWNRPQGPPQADAPAIIECHLDKVFVDKLETLTARHLAEPDFTIDRLAEMMNMGRTKFFGKVKELTGMSPNKYLQDARMRRASELLLEGELNISEVCYKVGMQDPTYFNKVFKARYGVVPSKYGK
jgi:AraC-like DNA-binding protein